MNRLLLYLDKVYLIISDKHCPCVNVLHHRQSYIFRGLENLLHNLSIYFKLVRHRKRFEIPDAIG